MTLTTASLLKTLGAFEDPGAICEDGVALALQIGPHRLHGSQFTSRWFSSTYRISGIINTGRSTALIESEMPLEVASESEGLAWLAEILRGAISEELKPAWLLRGERFRHLLPNRTGAVSSGRTS